MPDTILYDEASLSMEELDTAIGQVREMISPPTQPKPKYNSPFRLLTEQDLKNYQYYFRKCWLKKYVNLDLIPLIQKAIKGYSPKRYLDDKVGIVFMVKNSFREEGRRENMEFRDVIMGECEIMVCSPQIPPTIIPTPNQIIISVNDYLPTINMEIFNSEKFEAKIMGRNSFPISVTDELLEQDGDPNTQTGGSW